MRTIVAVAVLVLASSIAHAQPGNAPPPPPVYGGYAPPPPQPLVLTLDEQRILQRGQITDGEHFGGAFLAIFLGYGTGQAVEGRWSDTGWIFTVGEGASSIAFTYGLVKIFEDCFETTCEDGDDNAAAFMAIGVIGVGIFRIWGIVDAIAGPSTHNRRLREIQMKLGYPQQPGYYSVAPFVAPTHDGGGVAGFTVRF